MNKRARASSRAGIGGWSKDLDDLALGIHVAGFPFIELHDYLVANEGRTRRMPATAQKKGRAPNSVRAQVVRKGMATLGDACLWENAALARAEEGSESTHARSTLSSNLHSRARFPDHPAEDVFACRVGVRSSTPGSFSFREHRLPEVKSWANRLAQSRGTRALGGADSKKAAPYGTAVAQCRDG